MKYYIWLVWVAAALAAGCSCAGPAQELSTYWDDHDFTSLDGFDDIKAAEDKFDRFVELLSKVPHETAVAEMTKFMDLASQNVVAYMVWSGWFEPYLHAKESPFCNDELFIAWLDKVLEDNVIDDGSQMEHLATMRQIMTVNRVGMAPQDVSLFTEGGHECMLSDFAGQRTLILFVDADCPSCLEGLRINAEEYEDAEIQLLAVLANGSSYHLDNIRRQLPEEVISKWTFVYRSARVLESEGLYDSTLLPFRVLVSADWLIEKSYY